MLIRLLAIVLVGSSACSAGRLLTFSFQPVQTGFTGVFNESPADIWTMTVQNDNPAPIYSLEMFLEGDFIQVTGQSVVQPGSGLIRVAGVIDAADTYFSVPESISGGNIAVAPGTSTDDERVLAAAFTVTGNTPIIEAGGEAVVATLAMPPGSFLSFLNFQKNSAVLRYDDGRLELVRFLVPEPATLFLVGIAAFAAVGSRHYRRS